MDEQALARFLRARRAVIDPDDTGLVGLGPDTRRRVSGLRREEVATLAGLSVDYYVRLEQGRGHRPSESVLHGLARALRLDDQLTRHLFTLVGDTPPPATTNVPSELAHLLDAWTTTPASITDRAMNVVASNALARELASCYEVGTNLLRSVFLDPDTRLSHLDWDAAAAESVANFRARTGAYPDDAATRLVGELSLRSRRFRELWARHDVHTTSSGEKGFRHPEVGEIRLRLNAFTIDGGGVLTVLHAEPGSRDEQSLALLSALVGLGST